MSDPATGMDIAELARQGGVSSRTIRYYGELGLLRVDGRGPGGRRRYTTDALERLRFINRLKKLGLTLEEIGHLNEAFDRGDTPNMLKELESLLETHIQTVQKRVTELHKLQEELGSYLIRIREKRQREEQQKKTA